MKRYILASDFDGTLCQKGVISNETIDAIEKFRAQGHLFGVVTGRDYINGFEFFKKSNLFPFDFIIVNNGANAYDFDGNEYFAKTVNGRLPIGESTLAAELVGECLRLTPYPCVISFGRTRFRFHKQYPQGAVVDGVQYDAIANVKSVEEFLSVNADCNNEDDARCVTAFLEERFGQYVNPLKNTKWIDIAPAGIDKSVGIKLLADCLGVSYENIWTVGDNWNDMCMLQDFHGCAITSGVDALKSVSEFTCDNVADVIKIILSKQ